MSTTTVKPILGPAPLSPEWFEERFNHIGASEAAAACGVSRWKQPLDIYLEKRRLVEPFEGNEYTATGTDMEPVIHAKYTRATGIGLIAPVPMMISGVYSFMSASPDAFEDTSEQDPVELKTSSWRRGAEWGEEGTDQIPEDYLVQCQQQMFVAQKQRCKLAVMLDCHTMRRYLIHRHEALIDRMIELERELWERIQTGDPPAPNFRHPKTPELIKAMFGVEEGEFVDLSEGTAVAWSKYQGLGESIKELESDREAEKARVLHAMGNAAIGWLPDGRQLIRSVVNRKAYEVKAGSYVTLREKKAPKSK